MLRALGRVILLPIAFLVAAAATLFVIISLGQERIVQAMTGMRVSVDEPRQHRHPRGIDLPSVWEAGDEVGCFADGGDARSRHGHGAVAEDAEPRDLLLLQDDLDEATCRLEVLVAADLAIGQPPIDLTEHVRLTGARLTRVVGGNRGEQPNPPDMGTGREVVLALCCRA